MTTNSLQLDLLKKFKKSEPTTSKSSLSKNNSKMDLLFDCSSNSDCSSNKSDKTVESKIIKKPLNINNNNSNKTPSKLNKKPNRLNLISAESIR